MRRGGWVDAGVGENWVGAGGGGGGRCVDAGVGLDGWTPALVDGWVDLGVGVYGRTPALGVDGWTDGWMDGRTDGWMDGRMDRDDGWMDGRTGSLVKF